MHKILFICHGNICRSPMAELYMKDIVKKKGCEGAFEIDSCAATRDEIGNPVYPPMAKKLRENGIDPSGKRARYFDRSDYDYYDLLIVMDDENIRDLNNILGHDKDNKIHLLMEYAGKPNTSVSDPWFTRDFDRAWDDIALGCDSLLKIILHNY